MPDHCQARARGPVSRSQILLQAVSHLPAASLTPTTQGANSHHAVLAHADTRCRYELGFPKQLPQYYPLGLKTPDETNSTRIVLQAKYKELFERTGADGIVLTAEEVHPRGGYASMALASSPVRPVIYIISVATMSG